MDNLERVYLSFIPSFPTRVRVFFNWLLEFFVPRNAVLTNPLNNKPFEKKNYKRGDIVFEEGMIPDGFYIVQSGEFSNSYRKTTSGKTFKKNIRKVTTLVQGLFLRVEKNRNY